MFHPQWNMSIRSWSCIAYHRTGFGWAATGPSSLNCCRNLSDKAVVQPETFFMGELHHFIWGIQVRNWYISSLHLSSDADGARLVEVCSPSSTGSATGTIYSWCRQTSVVTAWEYQGLWCHRSHGAGVQMKVIFMFTCRFLSMFGLELL